MKKILSIAIISVVLFSGCSSITGNILKMSSLPSSTTAKDIVPSKISGYTTVNTDSLISSVSAAAVGLAASSLTPGNIKFTYESAQFTGKFITCYQEAGAVNSNGYYRNDNPLYGGAVIIADKNQITDPALLLTCIRKSILPFSVIGQELHPCALKFTIETDYNKFYVVGFGTDMSVCQDICKNMITGKPLDYSLNDARCVQ